MAANEDEEHGNDEQDQDNDASTPGAPKEKKKAPKYTEPEDYELCRAWVQVSEDPAVGTNQEATTFWQRIRTVYHEAVEGFNESGAPKWNTYCRDNNLKEAGKKKRARSPSSDPPQSQITSTPAPSDPISDFEGTGTEPSVLERPIGKKKAKTINQLAAQDQSWKQDVACAHKEIASESKRLNDIFKHDSQAIDRMSQNGTTASELAIMTTDLNGLDDEQKEYFKLKRAAILQSLRAQGNSSTN
ncbi:hypothetical protein PGT21_004842 [Puccinia graminis f. sp. tritici]|uniref:No apical meristem-associated C-terminal domain-containing protein n=1 Tax=Puccinia graminis f. sp. tritici TaxID=56615 RepID=A0A5B0PHP5_PUCGR|nr:hypothetical protein PGT21_004842 [Puccinia graminis f. sp. tritici]